MLPVLITIVVILASYVIWKLALVLHFWRKTGVKFIGFWETLKDNYNLFTKPLTEQTLDGYKKYGKVYGTYLGSEPFISIGDPLLLKNLFIKDFTSFADRFKAQKLNLVIWDKMVMNASGEEWRYIRSTITPSFSSSKMRLMVKTVCKLVDPTVENLLEDSGKGVPTDIKEVFGALSLDSVARLAFAVSLNSHKDLSNPFVSKAKVAFGVNGAKKIFFAQLFPWFFKVFRITLLDQDVLDFYDSFVRTVIQKRNPDIKENEVTDFLQLLLNTEAKLRENNGATNGAVTEKEKLMQEIFDLDCVVAQAILFFLAAYDTTGTALTFIAYELAINQHIQDRLIKEIDDNIKTDDDITYEKLNEMHYLDAVINENFRKNSVVIRLFRICTNDVDFGEYHIEKDTSISIPVHGIHHDPEYYPEPEKFNPDRFLPENKDSLVPLTFLPFGEGPRHCVGMRLALMNIKVAIIKVLKKVRFERCPETEVPIKYRTMTFLIEAANEIKLRVVKRNS